MDLDIIMILVMVFVVIQGLGVAFEVELSCDDKSLLLLAIDSNMNIVGKIICTILLVILFPVLSLTVGIYKLLYYLFHL